MYVFPTWRIAVAFALTPLIVALAFACMEYLHEGPKGELLRSIGWLTYAAALFGGYPVTLVFGIPLYLILRTQLIASVLNCAVVGSLITALPWFLIQARITPLSEFDFGHITVEHGIRTLWGWLVVLSSVGVFAALGGFGGFVFWAIAIMPTTRRRS